MVSSSSSKPPRGAIKHLRKGWTVDINVGLVWEAVAVAE